jgi:hypothetical protein
MIIENNMMNNVPIEVNYIVDNQDNYYYYLDHRMMNMFDEDYLNIVMNDLNDKQLNYLENMDLYNENYCIVEWKMVDNIVAVVVVVDDDDL